MVSAFLSTEICCPTWPQGGQGFLDPVESLLGTLWSDSLAPGIGSGGQCRASFVAASVPKAEGPRNGSQLGLGEGTSSPLFHSALPPPIWVGAPPLSQEAAGGPGDMPRR